MIWKENIYFSTDNISPNNYDTAMPVQIIILYMLLIRRRMITDMNLTT